MQSTFPIQLTLLQSNLAKNSLTYSMPNLTKETYNVNDTCFPQFCPQKIDSTSRKYDLSDFELHLPYAELTACRPTELYEI